MPTDVLRIGAQFDTLAIQAGMAQAVDAVESGTARMNTRFNRLGSESEAAMNHVAFSSTEARHALHGLGEEMGLHIPRFVQTFVAHMGGIGPLLASAFSGIAVIGLIQILAEIPEAIDKIVNKLAGWTKAEQEAYAASVKANKARIEFLDELTIKENDLATIGTKGADKLSIEQQNLNKEHALYAQRLTEAQKRVTDLRIAEEGRLVTHHNIDPRHRTDVPTQSVERKLPEGMKDWDEVTKAISEAQAEAEKYRDKLDEISKVKIVGKQKEAVVEAREAAAAYTELLGDMASRDSEQAQRGAEKDLAVFTRMLAERERIEEETEKSSRALVEKDLADFERSMIERTRIEEDQGHFELEQTRSRYEQRSRLIAAASTKGGSGPAVEAEALKALNEETTAIAKLIQLEEQLRQKLIQIGVAETDPRIEESLRKQQELVQQGNIAWQKYRNVVNQVAVDQEKEFRQSFDKISDVLNQNLIGWMAHTQSFGRATVKVWDSLATTAVNSLLRIAEQEAIHYATGKAIQDKQKLDDAKTAARGAFKWVMEDVPFPANAVLAPAAAAAAFAGVMAFEQGGIMPRTDVALLHRNEMVLPANISQKVQNMTGAGGGNHHYHIQINGASGSNAQIQDMVHAAIVPAIRRAQRNGQLQSP